MSFETIKLDKGLYTSNKGFTKSLEEIDPSENYKGTQYEGLDAYQRQLKRFDIKVSGKNSDTVAKFFSTTDSATLFPEFISRAVASGIEEGNIVNDIVATTTVIDSLDYRSIDASDFENPVDYYNTVAEGTFIPETYIRTKEQLTPLKKHGRSIVASYEAIKSQKLDIFAVALKQIGKYIAHCEIIDAVDKLVLANSNCVEAVSGGDVCYDDMVSMWKALLPYNMNVIVAEPDFTAKILQIPEFKDSQAGQAFHGTGNMVTPLGAKLVTVPTDITYGAICGFDKNYALEKVQFGDIITDFDKLIDRQLEKATVSCISGFNRIIDSASVCCS
ncbi:MAG: phage major capsid protein [Eubacterium sp.]